MSTTDQSTSISEHELVTLLLDPAVYPWNPERVDHLETHISRLFFAGDRVIKIKRPVKYGFVDHGSLARRRQSCLDEVRLNRLLSDDIYLEALPITRTETGLQLGGPGEPIEWAVLMRRIPEEAMLDGLLQRGERPEHLADRLAARLIPFHQRAGDCPGDPSREAADAERILRENLDEIGALTTSAVFPRELALIRRSVLGFLEREPEALPRRAEAGWIREGHGDLKCEHVVLDPPGNLQIYDCVEFSIGIRCADIASDLAFLLLDLERLGAADVARELVERYRAAGLDLTDTMLALYRSHRSLVRVKVAALTIENATEPHPEAARQVAEWLHRAAASALVLRPAIIAMTGLSGTGKSVVARSITTALGIPLLSTDAIRRELVSGEADRYAPERRLQIYERMLNRAEETLSTGSAVVLDGAFLRSEERVLAAHRAERAGVPLLFVEVIASPEVVDRRIQARDRGESAAFASEATADVLASQRRQVASSPPVRPPGASFVTIDTSANAPASLDPLFARLDDLHLIEPSL